MHRAIRPAIRPVSAAFAVALATTVLVSADTAAADKYQNPMKNTTYKGSDADLQEHDHTTSVKIRIGKDKFKATKVVMTVACPAGKMRKVAKNVVLASAPMPQLDVYKPTYWLHAEWLDKHHVEVKMTTSGDHVCPDEYFEYIAEN